MNGFELAELIRGANTRHPAHLHDGGLARAELAVPGYGERGRWTFCTNPSTRTCSPTRRACFLNWHRRKQALAHELRTHRGVAHQRDVHGRVLSHDLRTPLQSIVAAATVLKRQPPPGQAAPDGDGCCAQASAWAT